MAIHLFPLDIGPRGSENVPECPSGIAPLGRFGEHIAFAADVSNLKLTERFCRNDGDNYILVRRAPVTNRPNCSTRPNTMSSLVIGSQSPQPGRAVTKALSRRIASIPLMHLSTSDLNIYE